MNEEKNLQNDEEKLRISAKNIDVNNKSESNKYVFFSRFVVPFIVSIVTNLIVSSVLTPFMIKRMEDKIIETTIEKLEK